MKLLNCPEIAKCGIYEKTPTRAAICPASHEACFLERYILSGLSSYTSSRLFRFAANISRKIDWEDRWTHINAANHETHGSISVLRLYSTSTSVSSHFILLLSAISVRSVTSVLGVEKWDVHWDDESRSSLLRADEMPSCGRFCWIICFSRRLTLIHESVVHVDSWCRSLKSWWFPLERSSKIARRNVMIV